MANREHEIIMWRGEPITRRQAQAYEAAEKKIRRRYWGFRFQIPQGSNQSETSYSGTTHTGKGVADLWYEGIAYRTRRQKRKFVYVLTALKGVAGQAAFGRGPWDKMVLHFHICDLDTSGMDPNAAWQVGEYRLMHNGLSGGVRDKFPWRPTPIRQWRYQAK